MSMDIASIKRPNNFPVFIGIRLLHSIGMGLLGPFLIVFIQDFKSLEESFISFGMAIGITQFARYSTAYFAGRFSDKIGRKPLMIFGGFAMAGLTVCYTLITSAPQLYILQVFYGIAIAISSIASGAFVGDITEKKSRGSDMGKLDAITGIGESLATMAAGFLAYGFGVSTIFYVVAGILSIKTFLILFLIREDR